jgi:chromosome segregation ATPase
MIPAVIMQTVKDLAESMGHKKTSVVHLQRYFLRMGCNWLTLKEIAKITGNATHTAVMWSCKAVESEPQYNEIKSLLLNIKINAMSQVEEKLSGTLEFKMPQPATATSISLTKEQIYDQIGDCNRRIVYLEHNIPQLKERISNLEGDYESIKQVRSIIHAEEDELTAIKKTIREHRMKLIGRVEMEIEQVDKKIRQPNLHYQTAVLEQQKAVATEELITLLRLV